MEISEKDEGKIKAGRMMRRAFHWSRGSARKHIHLGAVERVPGRDSKPNKKQKKTEVSATPLARNTKLFSNFIIGSGVRRSSL